MSAYATASRAYTESSVLTAPPERLVVMLYDGAGRFLARAAAAIRGGDAGLAGEQIGPWTVQCLRLFGRGEMDALPAGDLGYIKLVGRLASLGRRATVPEVEEFYAPYEPYRGLVGTLTLAGLHRKIAQGPPLRRAA